MSDETETIELASEEVETIRAYQSAIENAKMTLGELRLQYLAAERRLMVQIEKSHQDFITHLRMLSQSRGVPDGGDWVFDQSAYVFRKRTA
jgi:hypothetical protein